MVSERLEARLPQMLKSRGKRGRQRKRLERKIEVTGRAGRVCGDVQGEKRSESGKEQRDRVLARGGELTKRGRIYEQGEEC